MSTLGRVWYARRGLAIDLLPTILYVAVLFWAGLIPLKSLPGPEFALADKVWHLLAFGGLTALLARTLRYFGRPVIAAAGMAAAVSATLGGLLEVFQSLTRFRSAEFADFVADALGAVLAYAVLRALGIAAGLTSAPAHP